MIVIITLPKYYSQNDEKIFFDWLKGIGAVKSFKGFGVELDVDISDDVSEEDFYEIMALFRRYKIDPKPLRALENGANSHWLASRKAYWHKKLYGK